MSNVTVTETDTRLVITLMAKCYHDEDLCDMEQDIEDCLNNTMIQKDENGFSRGTYSVVVIYNEDK